MRKRRLTKGKLFFFLTDGLGSNKEKNKSKKDKESLTFFEEVSKIDEIVDRIIEKNKPRIDKIHSEKLDVEKFSLKNKKGDNIYYLKKKSDKTNSEKESPEKENDYNNESSEDESRKKKKRIKFGKKKDTFDDEFIAIPITTEDLVESDEFELITSDIEETLEEEKPDKKEIDTKISEEKIKESSETEEPQEKSDTIEPMGEELTEKHELKSKEEDSKDIKDKDWISSVTDDLVGFKKKYEKNLKITGIDLTDKQEAKKEIKAEDEGVGASEEKKSFFKKEPHPIDKPDEKKEEKEEFKILDEGVGASKEKKSFFKKEPPSEDKPEDLSKESVEPEKFIQKIRLRVDSLFGEDLDEDDAKLLDEKIQESLGPEEKDQIDKKAASEALKLASEHLKDEAKKGIKAEDEGVGASKEKKSFFKKEPPSEDKPEQFETEDVEPEKIIEKPRLQIDSLFKEKPAEDDEKLLDEKIEETSDFEKKDLDDKKVEKEAQKLASEHIKKITKKERRIKLIPKKEIKAEDEGRGFFKKRRFLFKKALPSVDKPDESEKKDGESEKLLIAPQFNIESIPEYETNKDEAKLLDKKIDEKHDIDKKTPELEKSEAKAVKLANEHLKDKPSSNYEEKPLEDKEIKKDEELPMDISVTEKDEDHEHVFFDEGQSSFTGWSPRTLEKDRKTMTITSEGQGEIRSEDGTTAVELELPKEVLSAKSVKLTDLGFSSNEWEELDFYPLYEPFAYVELLRERESLDKCYFLVETKLTDDEKKLLDFINETMTSLDINTFELEEKGENKYLIDKLEEVIEEYNIDLNEESKNKIFYYIGKISLGLGKIDPVMRDPNIEDISCDGAGVPLFLYHRKFGSLKSNIRFIDEDELSSFVHRLAQKCGKHISIAEPMLDATMPDGSRIQMTLSDEITAKGSTFTIRKFRSDPFSPPDLVEFNTMSSEMIAYMWIAIENGVNTLFAGGTASGKTTALNALSLFIPRESKIVSIEETREINLPHPNWIPGVARSGFGEVVADKVVGEIDMYDLMKAALRQRPEYILVGEIRGREAYVLFQAMATGHATYSTVHADSAQSLIHRMEGKPINIPRIMLQSLDIVCLHVITRVKNIRARRCKQIIEVIDIDPTTKEILTNEVFRWDPVEDKFVYSGKSYVLERIRAEKDLTREKMTEEIKNRRSIVEWMNKNNFREFHDVAKIVTQYTENPEETLNRIEKPEKGAKK